VKDAVESFYLDDESSRDSSKFIFQTFIGSDIKNSSRALFIED
jgi:uncharacterized protein affecting Mg2+/Co2+ transport